MGRRRAGGGGRGETRTLHLVPAGIPARVRRHRALRRLVRHRQLALDHDRAAHPRARDAADARCVAPTGARLDHRRGARRRDVASVVGLSRASSSRRGSSVSSTSSGSSLPNTGLVFAHAQRGVAGLLAGILVTLVASLRPAIRATRVPPIAAVREGAILPPGEARRLRWRGRGAHGARGASRRSRLASSPTASARSRSCSGWARDAPHVHRRRALLLAARASARSGPRLAGERGSEALPASLRATMLGVIRSEPRRPPPR